MITTTPPRKIAPIHECRLAPNSGNRNTQVATAQKGNMIRKVTGERSGTLEDYIDAQFRHSHPN